MLFELIQVSLIIMYKSISCQFSSLVRTHFSFGQSRAMAPSSVSIRGVAPRSQDSQTMFVGNINVPPWEVDCGDLRPILNDGQHLLRGKKRLNELEKKINCIFSRALKKSTLMHFWSLNPRLPTTPIFASKCWWAITWIIISFNIYLILGAFLQTLYVLFEIKAKLSATSKDRNKCTRISLWFQVTWHLNKNGPHSSRRWHSPLPPLLSWPWNGQ